MFRVESYFQADERSSGTWTWEGDFHDLEEAKEFVKKRKQAGSLSDFHIWEQKLTWVPV